MEGNRIDVAPDIFNDQEIVDNSRALFAIAFRIQNN